MTSRRMRAVLRFFLWHCLIIKWTSSRVFENTSKRPRIFAQEPGDSQVSGHCGENKHRKLAVLVGLILKLSTWANSPWVGKGPPCQSLEGEGAEKAWCCPLVLLWESQCTGHVCLKFVMSNSFNVWGPSANDSIPLKHVLGWRGGEGRKSEGVMWPWILCL